jgi:threonine aldolase
MKRRGFLSTPLALAAATGVGDDNRVYAYGDGVPLSPAAYANLLQQLAPRIKPDSYSLGGTVTALEEQMAAVLGKEAAIWLPTGTLANHLAVRLLAQKGRRVLVQEQSHLYADSGDCAQTLSGLTLIPLGENQATYTLAEAEAAANQAKFGRVLTPVSALVIETPVRRKSGQRFDFEELKKLSAWAGEQKIGRHLDGARLFIESAYTGRGVREYASLFDTVYVSTYKYFNAPSGAILAGPKALLADLYHTRRMFGGSLPGAWPFAAVSLHYLEGFPERMSRAAETGEKVLRGLERDGNFVVERIPGGTNVFRLKPIGANAPAYQGRLEQAGISAHTPPGDTFTLQVNETWNRATAAEIVARFQKGIS